MLDKLINIANDDINKYIDEIVENIINPKRLVKELFDKGYVKSDLVDIVDEKFYGLRARVKTNINKDNGNFEKLVYKIIHLDIKPKIICIDEDGADLIFQPNNAINVSRKEDFFNILMKFIDYIENNQWRELHFVGWNFNHSNMITSENTKLSNYNFSEELYDSNEIECIGIREGVIRKC